MVNNQPKIAEKLNLTSLTRGQKPEILVLERRGEIPEGKVREGWENRKGQISTKSNTKQHTEKSGKQGKRTSL